MPTFAYTARNRDGQEITGSLTAESQQAALRTLDERALFPVKLALDTEGTSPTKRVKLKHLAMFYVQLSDLLNAGVPILRAMDTLARQNNSPALTAILKELRDDVAGGATLADAMEKHPKVFGELYVGMIRAGESGGFLEEVLTRLGEFVERRDELRNKVIGSLIYPSVLLLVGLGVVIAMVTVFVPKLKPLFENMELPAITVVVLGISDVLTQYYWIVLLVLGGIIAGCTALGRSERGKRMLDKWMLNMPLFGPIMRMVAVCRFCRVFGTMQANGITVLTALRISKDSAGNSLIKEALEEAAENVRAGETVTEPLRKSGLFPLDVVDMMSVGEESNKMDEVLIGIADSQEARTARQVDLVVRMIEPIMLLVVFAMVFVIALAFLLPILKLSSSGLN